MCSTHVRGFPYHSPINEDGEIDQHPYYFHCDQIGIQREMRLRQNGE
ncbi:hypothetical protein [Streptococcus sp. Marseille-Q0941]|nr:hypothetical protein [Streptococcus sp. Marseille-Q0941]